MTTTLAKKPESGVTEFVPFGSQDAIKLSVQIVQNLIAQRTKTGATCSDRDALKFIAMARAKRLNPFEGDCFLLGYDTKNGPSYTIITAHQAYLKRAEVHPEFDGMESGIVVRLGGGEAGDTELATEIMPEGAELVGGWARVHFKNRKFPMVKRLPLARFTTQIKRQEEWGGPWRDDPAGMVIKCAEADALRSAFPTMLGGLYLSEEVSLLNGNGGTHELPAGKLVEVEPTEPEFGERQESIERRQQRPEALQEPEPKKQPEKPKAAYAQLAEYCEINGVTFDQWREWAIAGGNCDGSLASFDQLPNDLAKRMLKAFPVMLQAVKGGGK